MIKRLLILGLATNLIFHGCKSANADSLLALQQYHSEDEASVSPAHSSDTEVDVEILFNTNHGPVPAIEEFSSDNTAVTDSEEEDDASKITYEFGPKKPLLSLFEVQQTTSYNVNFLNACSETLHALRRKKTIPQSIMESAFIDNLVRASYKGRKKAISPFHTGERILIPLWIEALARSNWNALIQMIGIWPDLVFQTYNGDPFYKLLAKKNPPYSLLIKLDELRQEQSYKAHSQLDKANQPPFTHLPAQTTFAVLDYFVKRTETYESTDDLLLYSRLVASGCYQQDILNYLEATDGFSYIVVIKKLIEEERYHGFRPLFAKIPLFEEQKNVVLDGLAYLLGNKEETICKNYVPDMQEQIATLLFKAFLDTQKSTTLTIVLLQELEHESVKRYPSHQILHTFLKEARLHFLYPHLKQQRTIY